MEKPVVYGDRLQSVSYAASLRRLASYSRRTDLSSGYHSFLTSITYVTDIHSVVVYFYAS